MVRRWIEAVRKLALFGKNERLDRQDVFGKFKEEEQDAFKELSKVVKKHEKKGKLLLKEMKHKSSIEELNHLLQKVKRYEETAWKNISAREAKQILRKLEKLSKKKSK